MMDLEKFCVALGRLQLNQPQQAVAILWHADANVPGNSRTAGELARSIHNAGLGNPHSTRLGEAVLKTKHVLKSGVRFRIKPTSRDVVRAWITPILNGPPPKIDHENGYLPEAVWKDTRGYIEAVARQINGCYEHRYYDGATVLVRRMIETLLIECYEHLKIEATIKKSDGNYPMLSGIISNAVGNTSLSLGRETKKALGDIKQLGDRSAHNRRYTAIKADLDKIESGVRVVLDELLHIAELK